jgi:hypothetical protein
MLEYEVTCTVTAVIPLLVLYLLAKFKVDLAHTL